MKRGMVLFLLGVLLLIEFTSATCTFRRLDWGPGTIVENTEASINIGIEGDTCQGKVISISVKEYDRGQIDDTPTNQPASVTILSNSPAPGTWVFAGGTWRAQFMEDVDHAGETNPPEYYIIATLDGVTATTREDSTYVFSNQYMTVTKYVAPVPQCTNDTWCKTYYGSNSVCLNGNCTLPAPPQCTNNTWCQSNYGVNYICSNRNCVINSSSPNPLGNSTAYIPKNCSDTEIKKTWDSIFKESSSGIEILPGNSSLNTNNNSCPYYFASKISGNNVYYIQSFILDLFGINLNYIAANSLDSKQEFIDLINSFDNFVESGILMDINLSVSGNLVNITNYSYEGIDVIGNYSNLRPAPLNLSQSNAEFSSIFKVNSGTWMDAINNPLVNYSEYIFINQTGNSSLTGILVKERKYASLGIVSLAGFNDTEENLTLKEQAGLAINQSQKKLQAFKNKTLSYPIFYRESIENAIDVVGIQQQINSIRNSYNLSNSSAEYQRIINLSNSLNIPTSISTTETADAIPFFPKRVDIAPEIVAEVTGEPYNSSRVDDYKEAILAWYQQNVESFIYFEEISVADNYGTNPLINVFRINIDEKTDTGENLHFVIRKLENIRFDRSYGETEHGNYVHINTVPGTIITFSTTEEVDFVDLPLFVSPDLTALSLASPPSPPEKDSRWWLYIIILLVILAIGAVGYILINKWYKNKYEMHLFKTKNNLFNILSYINNSKKNGMLDPEVRNRLRKSGWTGEQIDYAVKKYYGEKIFMTGSSGRKMTKNPKFVPRR